MDAIREALNRIDTKSIDEDTKFYDLRSLYEAFSPKFTPKEKAEFKKIVQSTDDPAVISVALQQFANESIEDDFYADDIELNEAESGNAGSKLQANIDNGIGTLNHIKDTFRKNMSDKVKKQAAKDKADYDRWRAFANSDKNHKKKNEEFDDYDDDDYDAWQMGNVGRFSKSDWIPTEDDIPEWARYDETLNESEDEYVYQASSYYGNNWTGLEDSIASNDYSEIKDWIWDKSNQGLYTSVYNSESGNTSRIDPDDILDSEGEFEIESNGDYRTNLHENVVKMTATDIVRDLYDKYPKVEFLDERDAADDKVALFFKFGGDITGLEDLVKSYGCDYKIANGKMRIIADEDEYIDESMESTLSTVGKVAGGVVGGMADGPLPVGDVLGSAIGGAVGGAIGSVIDSHNDENNECLTESLDEIEQECKNKFEELQHILLDDVNANDNCDDAMVLQRVNNAFKAVGGRSGASQDSPTYVRFDGRVGDYTVGGSISGKGYILGDLNRLAEDLTMAYNVKLGGQRGYTPAFIKKITNESLVERYSDEGEDEYYNMLDDLIRYYNRKTNKSIIQIHDEIMSEFDDETLADDVIANLDKSLTESNDDAYSYDEIAEILTDWTNNGTKASGGVTAYLEAEKNNIVKWLDQHYKVVEVSDGRMSADEGTTWNISYSNPNK